MLCLHMHQARRRSASLPALPVLTCRARPCATRPPACPPARAAAAAIHAGRAQQRRARVQGAARVPAGRVPGRLPLAARRAAAGAAGALCVLCCFCCVRVHVGQLCVWAYHVGVPRVGLHADTTRCAPNWCPHDRGRCYARLRVTLAHARASRAQPDWYRGLMLLAPMISLDKVKARGLNPLLM
jgi:hypothetical protein